MLEAGIETGEVVAIDPIEDAAPNAIGVGADNQAVDENRVLVEDADDDEEGEEEEEQEDMEDDVFEADHINPDEDREALAL